MTMTKHPQTPISPLFPPSYFLLAELDPDPPPSPLAPSQPLGAPWTHSLFQDLEHPQNCSRSWDIARTAVGPGIFPGLLGNWDIPRTAWGLGIPRTAWGLEYPPGQHGGWDILVIWAPGSTSGSFGMLSLPRSTLQGSVSLGYSLSLLWF